jgi:tetratricopeptide (TPR) repeat protein
MNADTAPAANILIHAAGLRDQGRLDAMAAALDAHLASRPEDGPAWALRAQAALLLRRDQEAVAAIQQALRHRPDAPLVQANLARVLLRRGDAARAAEAAARALTDAPEDPEIRLVVAGVEVARGAREAALARVDTVVADRPDLPAAHATRAMVLLQLGRREAARASVERAVALGYVHPEAWRLALGAGDRPMAIDCLRRWLDVAPEDAKAAARLAELLRLSGDSAAAVELWRRAVAQRPDEAANWHGYGAALQELNRLDEAVVAYERALALAPGFPGVAANLAVLHEQRGEASKGAEILARYCAERPDDAAANLILAKLLERLDRPDHAAAAYARTLAVDSENLSALRGVGQVERVIARYQALARETALTADVLEDWLQLALSHPDQDVEAIWAHAPRAGGDARIQARLAVYPLISRWMRGDERGVAALLEAHGANARTAERRDRNPFVYLVYVTRLLAQRRIRPDLYHGVEGARPVQVIGESHALALAGLVARWTDGLARFAASLLMGAQMSLIGAGVPNRWRTQLDAHLERLPKGSDLLFTIGEIDCRPEHGIWQTHRRTKEPPDVIAERLVARYLDHLANACRGFGAVAIQGVPAPNREIGPLLRPGEDTGAYLAMFEAVNAALAAGAAARGWRFLDVYGPTRAADGRANGLWHIDDHHLSPLFYAEPRLR